MKPFLSLGSSGLFTGVVGRAAFGALLVICTAFVPHVAVAGFTYSLKGKVTYVNDGDTIELQVSRRERVTVRLASIDAPEIGRRNRPSQPFAQAARRALQRLVQDEVVTAECYEEDHYARHICDIVLPDGTTANQYLVHEGLVWANMEKGGRFMRDPALPKLEREAQEARRGLWAQSPQIQPWVWRYQCWNQNQCNQ